VAFVVVTVRGLLVGAGRGAAYPLSDTTNLIVQRLIGTRIPQLGRRGV
jgi:hypothetical protein